MEKFDNKYRNEELYWSQNPSRVVKLILKYKQNGDVLDLGVGEGRNSLFLAKNGFNVTGIDISNEGVRKFKRTAEKSGLGVKAIHGNINDFQFDKDYDLILSNSTLHFLSKKEAGKLIEKMKGHTSKNGLNVITAFTKDNPNKNFNYLFNEGELRDFYDNWEILHYDERTTPLEKHGRYGKWHRHGIAEIMAKKV